MTKLQYAQLLDSCLTEQDIENANEKVVFADMQDEFKENWEWFVAHNNLCKEVADDQKYDCIEKAMMETIKTGKLVAVDEFFDMDEYKEKLEEGEEEYEAMQVVYAEVNRWLSA